MAHKKEGLERISDPRVDRIWEVMKERKMTITELSKKAKTTFAHTNKVLNGRMPLKPNFLEKLAIDGLGLPPSFFEEVKIENKQKPKTRKNAPLMSEILDGIEETLRFVENVNVDTLHKFFFENPEKPLIATGHGGKYAPAVYAALLYGTYQGLGRAVTCYSCNSLSDAVLRNSKVLLVSKGMANIDITYIANRCIELNPQNTCAIRIKCDDEEKKYKDLVAKLDRECKDYSLKFDIEVADNFISIRSIFFYMSLLYKAFTGDSDFVSELELNKDPLANYEYSSANGLMEVPTLDKINRFTVLYGSYGEPIAYNIESNIVESGIGSCMISDYKNYTHGRFMVEGNYIKSEAHPLTEAALICIVTPREAQIYEDLIAEMPPHLPIITIRTNHITPLATIDLLYKANRFVAYLGEHFYNTNPNYPTLYSNSIDKRIPKNHVDFKDDFKVYGALDIETEKAVIGKLCKELKIEAENLSDLFKIRDSILEKEQWRTGKARLMWEKAKPLSWDDFSFRKVHEYNTEKQECWSFNSKNDVRDGIKLQLGNMANGFGVNVLGIDFPNTEIPYQLAIFNNEKDSIKLQEEIVDPSKGWLGNGLKMKRKFIYAQEYKRYLRDTEFENGKEMWCFEWMKWITWEKVRQNKEFKNILLSIPKNAIIIEQAQKRPTKDRPSMWGAWNEELKKERNIIIRTAQIENGLKKGSKATQVQDVLYAVNNVGTWIGENSEGQILTMAKLALNEEINLPIDADMLNEAKINWFGKVLQFTKHEDGLVTVEAVVPKIGKAPTKGIIGAIVGDIQGSIYELQEDKDKIKKDFSKKDKQLSTNKQLSYTDDTVLTIATAKWLLENKEHDKETLIDLFRHYGDSYQRYKFSRKFRDWIKSGSRKPLGDADDGSAMRVSPIGYYAKNIRDCLELARISAEVTHNTEEGIRGAQAIAAAIFLNRCGLSKKDIKEYISGLFPTYNLKRKLDTIRPKYEQCFNCDNVIPESIICFIEGKDYTETVNLAISLGGDTDTMASMAGAIAAVNNEVPREAAQYAYEILPNEFRSILDDFTKRYKKEPSAKLKQPSEVMDLVNVQPIEEESFEEVEVVEEPTDDEAELMAEDEEAELVAAESPMEDTQQSVAEVPKEAFEGDIELMPDMEVNGYKLYCCYTPLEAQQVKKTRWCYCNSEGKYNYYTQESGFLFVAARKGYKGVKNPHKGNDVKLRFKLYDDFATSLFSLTTFINPKTNKVDVYSVTFRRNDTSHQYEGQHMNTYNEMMEKTKELLGGFDFGKYCIEKTEEHINKFGIRNKADATKGQETAIPDPQDAKRWADGEIIDKKKKTSQEVRKQAEPKKRGRKPKNQSVQSETEAPKEEIATEVQETTSNIRVHGIIGAVIGEIIGSRFEFAKSLPKRHYELFASQCSFTDDTVLTVAIADSLLHGKDFKDTLWEWALHYPHAGFGKSFKQWKKNKKKNEEATNDSKGNGCGMRVSPIGFHANTLEETLELARQSAIISHNSDEGIKGAQSIAAATFLAKQQTPKEEIKSYIEETFGYNLHMTDEEIKAHVDSLTDIGERQLAENTCPLAIIAFLVTDDYEDAIRKAIGYFIDTDTVACMTGGIAAAYYGVPQYIVNEVADFLPQEIIDIINEFDQIHLQNTRTTPKDCHRWGDIFVYGSGDNKNGETEGFTASKYFGAGKMLEGMDKRAYAIPTVGRSLDEIRESVDRFIEYAETNQDKTFLVTRIGCSKAGYTPKDIAPMFERASNMTNVYLPIEFRDVLNTK